MVATSVVMLAAVVGQAFESGAPELLAFSGQHCHACQQMQPVLDQLQQSGYAIRKVDVEQSADLARQFGITSIPTFIVIRDGQVVDQVVGAVPATRLVQMYQQVASRQGTPATSPGDGLSPSGPTVALANSNSPPMADASVRQAQFETAAFSKLALSPQDAFGSAMASTVRLKVLDDSGHSFGTGTIIDVHNEEALVITCGHIFRDSDGKGTILCDVFGDNPQREVEGKLISYDLRRDVGLVSVRPGTPVHVAQVGGAGQRPATGDSVFSIGCNRGADPTVNDNKIIAVNRYHGPANLVVGGKPIDGRSGGGLFNADGVLIGICCAADQERDEGVYAALGPVHAELDRAGLGFIYRDNQPALAIRPSTPANSTADSPSATPAAHTPTAAPSLLDGPGAAAPSLLAPPVGDQGRALNNPTVPGLASNGGTEVICIVRAEDAGQASRFFVIDRPSEQLKQQISAELGRRGPLSPTQMRRASADARAFEGDWRTAQN